MLKVVCLRPRPKTEVFFSVYLEFGCSRTCRATRLFVELLFDTIACLDCLKSQYDCLGHVQDSSPQPKDESVVYCDFSLNSQTGPSEFWHCLILMKMACLLFQNGSNFDQPQNMNSSDLIELVFSMCSILMNIKLW